jgi:methylenetetrahydrofolate dehydrogenase (NADP+) / methenyltetrahydrofolate cyclohydrolase
MGAKIINGEAIARSIRSELQQRVLRLSERGLQTGLAVVVVGEDPASLSYIRAKTRAAEEAGIACETLRLSETVSQEELLVLIGSLNADPRYHALLVQQPLPPQIDPNAVVEAVAPEKDADGLHPFNAGLLLQGRPRFVPCTALGIYELLRISGHDPAGKRVAILGRSNLVGKPLAALLMQRGCGGDATVTVCHRQTAGLSDITRDANIVVAAAGCPGLISAPMIAPGAIVIDVGINRVPDPSHPRGYRLVGDVDFESVSEIAGAITPVPGGVGPMTVVMLLANTVKAAELALAG